MIARQWRLMRFHLVQFIKVPYFVSLMVVSTLSVLAVQALALYAWGGDPWVAWVRSAIIGMWTTTTAAAGILGFERFKGTLVHVVIARVSVFQPLTAVVSAASVFGLFAFALSWASWGLIWAGSDVGWGHSPLSAASFPLLVLYLWVTCLVVSFVVAAIFVLTPNAITYEGLLLVPVFLLSGLVFTTTSLPPVVAVGHRFIPFSAPARILLGQVPAGEIPSHLALSAVVLLVWLIGAWLLAKAALKRARYTGTLEVM